MFKRWYFEKHYSYTSLDRKTNFVEVSKAFGANGETVLSLEELNSALKTAFNSEGPYVIDCAIEKDELVLPMIPQGGSIDDLIVKVGE